jgi:hypothetical protein
LVVYGRYRYEANKFSLDLFFAEIRFGRCEVAAAARLSDVMVRDAGVKD